MTETTNAAATTTTPATTAAPVAISLTKGKKISLTKDNPGLNNLIIGLGWKPRRTDGEDFDLDAAAFLLAADGKVRSAADVVSYMTSKTHASGAVVYSGDNQTGDAEGDDEWLNVDLSKVEPEIQKIAFTASIYGARQRKQNFGQVDDACARLLDANTGAELYRFDLSEEASTNTAVIFVRLYRHDGQWKFEAVGQGFDGGLQKIFAEHGLDVPEEVV